MGHRQEWRSHWRQAPGRLERRLATSASWRAGRLWRSWQSWWPRRSRWIWRRTKTYRSPPIRDSLLGPQYRQSALAANRARGNPARRFSPRRRQFRVSIADHRWPTGLRLLRLARALLLRFGGQTPMESGPWRYAHRERLRRRQFTGALQKHSDCQLGQRRRLVHRRPGQKHRQNTLEDQT